MAYTHLSLRAAILLSVIAVGEVAALQVQARHDNGVVVYKKHRRRRRCSPPHTTSSSALAITESALPTTSTFETIIIPTSTYEISSEETTTETTSAVEETTTSSVEETTTSSVEETTTSAEEITASLAAEPTTTSSVEETTTSSVQEITTSTAEPASTSESVTSTEAPIASTTEPPTTTSEFVPTTTSTTICEPTLSTWIPELCWRTIPARCSSMTITTLPPLSVTAHINACNSGMRGYDAVFPTGVADCFANQGQPGFNPSSAYNCISNAGVVCTSTSACALPTATSAPIIPEYNNPSFESGDLGSWKYVPGSAGPGNLLSEISTEQVHSGSYSLKLQVTNSADATDAWTHRVRFEPGARYEFAFWYYQLARPRGTLSIKVEYPGTGISLPVQMNNQPAGTWVQQKFSLTPSTSFGTFSLTYLSVNGQVGNVIYVDDVTVTKIG